MISFCQTQPCHPVQQSLFHLLLNDMRQNIMGTQEERESRRTRVTSGTSHFQRVGGKSKTRPHFCKNGRATAASCLSPCSTDLHQALYISKGPAGMLHLWVTSAQVYDCTMQQSGRHANLSLFTSTFLGCEDLYDWFLS